MKLNFCLHLFTCKIGKCQRKPLEFLFYFFVYICLQIDSFVLDEHEEETGELSEDSRLDDEDLEEDSEDEEDEDEDEDEDDLDGVDPHQRFLLPGASAVTKDDLDVVVDPVSGSEIYPPVDPETQAKLEALFETAGIGKLAGETKQFTDPEVRIDTQNIRHFLAFGQFRKPCFCAALL